MVAAVLVVLFVCRQPPRSGNAGPLPEAGLAAPAPVRESPASSPGATDITPGWPAAGDDPRATELVPPAAATPSAVSTPDNPAWEPAVPPRPKRIGIVDTRNCPDLGFRGIRYGEVTARWVWDGQKMVARPVVAVKETDGSISIWSFDDPRDGVVVSELPQETR